MLEKRDYMDEKGSAGGIHFESMRVLVQLQEKIILKQSVLFYPVHTVLDGQEIRDTLYWTVRR